MKHSLKNIGTLLKIKWQSFRAWQEHPINYRIDETEHVCNNCGHTFRGNYCPVCSQSARHGRISWLSIYQGIGQLWGIESRSAIYTLWQLLLRPGYLVRDYISGKRQVSYPPVKLLFILATIVALAQYFFPRSAPEQSQIGYRYVDYALNWMNNHQNISELLNNCLLIFPTWFLFRKAPLYPNHTIPEGFFIQVYAAILGYVISSVFYAVPAISMLLSIVYAFLLYKQLFGFGFWGTLWRFAICCVLSLATGLIIGIIGAIISVI